MSMELIEPVKFVILKTVGPGLKTHFKKKLY